MDILLEISLSAGWAAVFLYLISRISFFRAEGIPIKWLQGVFLLKILFGVALWAIYTFYYTDRFTSDIYKYFDDSKAMYDAIKTQPVDFFKMMFGYQNDGEYFNQYYYYMNNWFREYDTNIYNDSHTMIRLNAALRLVSFGYFNVHTVFMCFISLLGLTAIYKTFEPVLRDKPKLLFAAIFLLPSVLFWGSGVLKEGLLFFSLGFMLYFFNQILKREGVLLLNIFWVGFSIVLMAFTKFYVLGAVLPGLVALAWLRLTKDRLPVLKFAIVFGVCIVVGLGAHKVSSAPDPLKFLAAKQKDFNLLIKGGVYLERISPNRTDTLYIESQYYDLIDYEHVWHMAKISEIPDAWLVVDSVITEKQSMIYGDSITFHVMKDYGKTGSSIKTGSLEPNLWSFVKALPRALYNAFFRPWPFESFKPFILFSGIENFLIVLFMLYAIIKGNWRAANKKWIMFCLCFVMVIYLLTGFTTPVLGSIVRYRVPGIPFLLIAGLLALTSQFKEEHRSL